MNDPKNTAAKRKLEEKEEDIAADIADRVRPPLSKPNTKRFNIFSY
jgi:hypothetical protein